MMKQVWVKRPTIARNTSGFSRREIMDALKVCGKRPSPRLLLDLTSTRANTRGWCASIGEPGIIAVTWRHNGTQYVADCHIRLRVNTIEPNKYGLHAKRGSPKIVMTVTRWQALCLLLAHELEHWRQAIRDGKVRCLQIECDRAALRVARKLGVVET